MQSITLPQALRLAEQSAGHPVTYATTLALSQHSGIVAGSSAMLYRCLLLNRWSPWTQNSSSASTLTMKTFLKPTG